MITPFAVLFDLQHYTPDDAHSFLQSIADTGMIDTELEPEKRGDSLYMKSVQCAYDGPFAEISRPDCPGLILLFAKEESQKV